MNIHIRVTFKDGRQVYTYWDANELTLHRVNDMIGNSMGVESIEILSYRKG